MTRLTLIAIASLATLACNRNNQPAGDPEFADATPEVSAFQIELTGDPSEGVSTSDDQLVDEDISWQRQAEGAELPEYLAHARGAVKALNAAVANILEPIIDVIKNNPNTKTGDSHIWIKDRGTATYRFGMKKTAVKRFGWLLQAKPVGAADSAYVNVMGGVLQQGDLPHRGVGTMGMDLDKLATIDTTIKPRGQLLVGFAHVGGYKILKYGLKGFTPDPAAHQPISALFTGYRGPKGGTDVRLSCYANIKDSATAAKELVLLRARWLPGVGGRCDAMAALGDIPQGHGIVSFSCFTGSFVLDTAKGFIWVGDCEKGQVPGEGGTCKTLRVDGKLANCALGLEKPALPPEDPNGGETPPEGVPTDPEVPAAIPDGSGN